MVSLQAGLPEQVFSWAVASVGRRQSATLYGLGANDLCYVIAQSDKWGFAPHLISPWSGQIYGDHFADAARLRRHDRRSIRQIDRLIDVVRHQDNCFALLLLDLKQEVLHDGARQ